MLQLDLLLNRFISEEDRHRLRGYTMFALHKAVTKTLGRFYTRVQFWTSPTASPVCFPRVSLIFPPVYLQRNQCPLLGAFRLPTSPARWKEFHVFR